MEELKKRLKKIGIFSEPWYTIETYKDALILLFDRVAELEAEVKKLKEDTSHE